VLPSLLVEIEAIAIIGSGSWRLLTLLKPIRDPNY
jgi:hypothetical protein